MTKGTMAKKSEPSRHRAATRHHKEGLEVVKTYLPPGSPQRAAASIAAAAGGALLAAAVFGAGPAALAGAAGYLVYHEIYP